MKPIFEPGFYGDIILKNKEECDMLHKHLTALGIDAETPQKLKRYELRIDTMQKTMAEMKDRLAEVERMLAEAPIRYSRDRESWFPYASQDVDPPFKFQTKLVDIKPILKTEAEE